MKPYKLKRRQEEQRKKNPTRAKRKQILISTTKKIALQRFNDIQEGIYNIYPRKDVEIFEVDFWHETMDDFNLQYTEIEMMYPLYQRCMEALFKKKEKSDYLKRSYKPLDSDLFEIV